MICSSDQHLEYFSDNKPYSFKLKLNQAIELRGRWNVALTEITLNEVNKNTEETLYIYF